MSQRRDIDWMNIDWETVNFVDLRDAAHEGLDPEWVEKYGVASFDAALVCAGVIAPNETVDSIEAARHGGSGSSPTSGV